jgi:hypothetical protein
LQGSSGWSSASGRSYGSGALGEAYEEARTAFAAAKDAYVELQRAHRRGRFDHVESANFRRLVSVFREAAADVHRQVRAARGEQG